LIAQRFNRIIGKPRTKGSAVTSIRDYAVLLYWAAYLVLTSLPRLLYRKEHKFGLLEMYEAFPRYRRLLNILPRLSSGLMVVLLVIIFAMWLSPGYDRATSTQAIGIAYGALLVLDALLAWLTGIRPIIGWQQRYVVAPEGAWRPMLQFSLSLLFLAVPILFLLNR
jgi:hypothetical protein